MLSIGLSLLNKKLSNEDIIFVINSHCNAKSFCRLMWSLANEQMESGQRRTKELLKEYCFPYIHKGDFNCTFDWKITLEKLHTQIVGQHVFRSLNIYSSEIEKKVQHYIDFLQPYETIATDHLVKMIQNATTKLSEVLEKCKILKFLNILKCFK